MKPGKLVLTRAEARTLIDSLKDAERQRSAGGDECAFGLRFRNLASGQVTQTHATYAERHCRVAAETRNARWPHQETTVYRRGEPRPTREQVQSAEQRQHGRRRAVPVTKTKVQPEGVQSGMRI